MRRQKRRTEKQGAQKVTTWCTFAVKKTLLGLRVFSAAEIPFYNFQCPIEIHFML